MIFFKKALSMPKVICMKMKLMKNKKNICSKNIHERYLYPKLQPILRRGSAKVMSLLHVNSLW